MRTNTRVEFGLYDVTARGDSNPTCDAAQPFCSLRRDLLVEAVPSQVKYGTLESRQWLMDLWMDFLFIIMYIRKDGRSREVLQILMIRYGIRV